MNESSYELGKAGKRPREGDTDSSRPDRLSQLPGFILSHILSFLDTKSAVQTCVLSRVWRCAWKYVSVLSFRSDSFQQYSSFQLYVDEVLSLRFPLSVRMVSYVDDESSAERDRGLFARVIKYAVAHDAQHLVIDLNNGKDIYASCRFSSLLSGTIFCCKTLELRRLWVDTDFRNSTFPVLMDLTLEQCVLVSYYDEDINPFSGFPCLKNLVLTECVHSDIANDWDFRSFKIYGSQLLSLKLDCLHCTKLEICAPKLKFFTLEHDLDFLKISSLRVPSLIHADIRISDEENAMNDDNKEQFMQRLIFLFQCLKSATSLQLDYYSIQVLSNISELLEKQPSPFTRLKSLGVEALTIPHSLIDYFLKGSSSVKPNVKYGVGKSC
ncbi:unnamed protein product [Linum tenue]|uniref:F-box domain-containing protein n=1 Tax=Linum tenue TaxID=586396 RepID=A0AAV0JTY4_9ROSI|nr:unnamed protein product [Linum tenue]